MPVSAANFLSLAVDGVRDALSQSATFQTWTGTVSAGAAKLRALPVESLTTETLPHATLLAVDCARERDVGGAGSLWSGDVVVSVLFRETISQSDTTDAYYSFMNSLGAIWAEVEAQATARTRYADIRTVRMARPAQRPDFQEANASSVTQFYEAILEFTVGTHT